MQKTKKHSHLDLRAKRLVTYFLTRPANQMKKRESGRDLDSTRHKRRPRQWKTDRTLISYQSYCLLKLLKVDFIQQYSYQLSLTCTEVTEQWDHKRYFMTADLSADSLGYNVKCIFIPYTYIYYDTDTLSILKLLKRFTPPHPKSLGRFS